MAKIFEVEVRVVTEGTMIIEAETKQEAMKIAETLANDSNLESVWHSGGEAYDSFGESVSLVVVTEPTESDKAEAKTNAEAWEQALKEMDCEYASEDSNVCVVHNKDH